MIINEVTHANPSQLRGMLEVAGHGASVVIANPWGITCNGCGFINTPYASLTTGVPQFDAQGHLTGYRVEKGNVTIEGSGLDAKSQDYLAIMTRALTVNAAIHAKDLQVVLGTNHVDVHTGKVSAITVPNPDKPQYALDVSQLGGMYANKT
ncbi:filamentous hemagglutinin N-terminal domain-containing protein [Parachlamydia acanthamoebae]|uniref:Filamentous haemagglutinin FhaB/tRNA nuclease CdiA-like TPS domain-containing protein n=1 Tax=Parachlamydia acanthamoebae TaxID=83552 RepID=A0A0C1EHG8_9BACT|nr:filamentous hemagglutinin N-terminal domain-containing protein [Parachlamydia acanthamoebae]KIA76074.1 hypothetical protein DB43_BG00020 [Parachlamydia acanthamoebae]